MRSQTITRRAPEGPNSLASYESGSRRLAGRLGSPFAVTDSTFPQLTADDFREDRPTTYGPALPPPTEETERDYSWLKRAAEAVTDTTVGIIGITQQQRAAQAEADRRRRAADMAEHRSALDIRAAREEQSFMQQHGAAATNIGIPLLLGGAALVAILLMTKK